MPIHFKDLDIIPKISGLHSALIVPCLMCPAITVAVREKKPFLNLFRHFLKSEPFERYIRGLRSQLENIGMETEVFQSHWPHQWFLCMWTSGQVGRLWRYSRNYEAAVVLGCGSATVTVRNAVHPNCGTIVEGMAVTGIMNATLSMRFPGSLGFTGNEVVPISSDSGNPAQ